MYEQHSLSVKQFITDSSIRLPRFQRKRTWTPDKNFNLCLSLFKRYPLGVVVLKREEIATAEGKKSFKYLLDGRQRREALMQMPDPDAIYEWARRTLRLKTNFTQDEVSAAFWEYMDNYFGKEDWEEESGSLDYHLEEVAEGTFEALDLPTPHTEEALDEAEEFLNTETAYEGEVSIQGLRDLLRIILAVHPRKPTGSGFTNPFDLDKYFGGLDYILAAPGEKKRVRSERLIKWLAYKKATALDEDETVSKEVFFRWLSEGSQLLKPEPEVKSVLDQRWPAIEERLQVLDLLDRRLTDTLLGYLEIKDAGANDEKKIFEIINTAGTPLTAAEILSAKPAWNRVVKNPDERIIADTERLYRLMRIPPEENVVRWDVAATALDRITLDYIFERTTTDLGNKFERRVTLGFQLMAGYYLNKIARVVFDELGKKNDIPWGECELEDDLTAAGQHLATHPHFKFWRSWSTPLLSAMSAAVALNFILVMTKDWVRKDRPTTGVGKFAQFQKNGIILLDRSIFEYVTGRWSGSGDSKIAQNLSDLSNAPDVFTPVPAESWTRLIEDVVDKGMIENSDYTSKLDSRVKLLLHYYYVLRPVQRPEAQYTVDVDHIIPQALFTDALDEELRRNRHHITNLSYLPFDDNRSKGAQRLDQITDEWLEQQIEKYAEIPGPQFADFSGPHASAALKALRGPLLKAVLINKRQALIEQ